MKRNNGNGQQPSTNFGGLVDDFFQKNLSQFFDDNFWATKGSAVRNVPVNVRETEKTFELHLMAPGLKKEDLKVDVQSDLLTISYQHKDTHTESGKDNEWLRQEYSVQSFSRSFNLDDTIDVSKITAQYNNGMLLVILPKKEGAQRISRAIEIK